jgi:hypothetical protein
MGSDRAAGAAERTAHYMPGLYARVVLLSYGLHPHEQIPVEATALVRQLARYAIGLFGGCRAQPHRRIG